MKSINKPSGINFFYTFGCLYSYERSRKKIQELYSTISKMTLIEK